MRWLFCLFVPLMLATSCRLNDFDEDGFDPADDCDNFDPDTYPGAEERCDGKDNDCDGVVDEDTEAVTFYEDADADGYGIDASTVSGCTPPDGFSPRGGDCDDEDPFTHPFANELCDGRDNDCDDEVDEDLEELEWFADTDGDGFGDADSSMSSCSLQSGYVLDDTDCDDGDAGVNPAAVEACGTGEDRDCDGEAAAVCASCLDVFETGEHAGSGEYTIDPDGPGPIEPLVAYCDMTTDGGGWTLVQRTVWEWSESQALMTDYQTWATQTIGTPGADAYRMLGAAWPFLAVQGDHLLVHALRTDDGDACAPLYYRASDGFFLVTPGETTVTAVTSDVTFFNNTSLSTADSGPGSACVSLNDAVPWFYGNCCAACPTYDGALWDDEAHPSVFYSSTPDLMGNARSDVCSGETPVQADNGSPFYGVDEMSYLVR